MPQQRQGYDRVMEGTDNLALAARTFCRCSPRIVAYEEETLKPE